MPEGPSLQRWLEQGWYEAPPRLLLRPLAGAYRLVQALRRGLYGMGVLASAHPGVPTIVIGNLTVGGTGKTPLALWLAARLRVHGRTPGLVLRGYGGSVRAAQLVRGSDDPRHVGDEAVLLARRSGCAVAVGAQRVAAARLLAKAGCDCVIADDGLQHLALRHDLSLLVIDGARGFGNGALLPAGPLREPIARARNADFTVLNASGPPPGLPVGVEPLRMRLVALALRRLGDDAEMSLQSLRGRSLHALAGIGNPQRFFALLRELGAEPLPEPRPDHHRFTAADLRPRDGRWIVITEKDAVKCASLAAGRDDLYYLQVRAELAEADATRLIDRVLAIRRS